MMKTPQTNALVNSIYRKHEIVGNFQSRLVVIIVSWVVYEPEAREIKL